MTAEEAGTYTWDTTGPYVGDCITNIIYTCLPLQSQAAASRIFFKTMPIKKIKTEKQTTAVNMFTEVNKQIPPILEWMRLIIAEVMIHSWGDDSLKKSIQHGCIGGE